MRKFVDRPDLPVGTVKKLAAKIAEIVGIADLENRKTRARTIFDSSRDTVWFSPVKKSLQGLCGLGQLCMYCSSNEPSQVEHFRPLSLFPELAMDYRNYLWSCDICNRTYKGTWFPPLSGVGAELLNPLDDYVWDFFYIDDTHGRLMKRFDLQLNVFMARAVSTCEYVGIDREVVQIKRQRRFQNLRCAVLSLIDRFAKGNIDRAAVVLEIGELCTEPFQADVADYFLNGPGKSKVPFSDLFAIVDGP